MHLHIIGVGSIGSLLAFHLRRTLPSTAKITLMLKAPAFSESHQRFDKTSAVTVERGGQKMSVGGFDWEIVRESLADSGGIGRGLGGASTSRHNANPEIDPQKRFRPRGPFESLVFNNDGSVRNAFRYNELEGKYNTDSPKFQFTDSTSHHQLNTPKNGPISSLIVLTKCPFVLPALRSVRHRLSPSSTVVLFQNGMGVYEELVSSLFRNPEERPHFVLGSVTHGVWRRQSWDVVHHMGPTAGEMRFGIVPDGGVDGQQKDFEKSYWSGDDAPHYERQLSLQDIVSPSSKETRYKSLHTTVSALLGLTELNPSWIPISHLQTFVRQKLVANCIINPMTALLGCRNGDLFVEPSARRIATSICKEAEAVFRAELKGEENESLHPDLHSKALLANTTRIAHATSMNLSSMLIDVRAGRTTEINYLNGYLSELGKRLNVKTPTIDCLLDMIRIRKVAAPVGFGDFVSKMKL